MSKWRNSASSQRTAANSAPMPLNSSNILPAGAGAAGRGAASSASRSASTGLDPIKQQFEPIEFAPDLGLEMHRQGTAVARRQLVEPLAPIAVQRLVTGDALGNNSPLTRLTCLTRSAISTLRSRQRRRRSSSSGVGAFTIAHTRGSPRLYASNARSRASPSILSVLARRRRRDVAIDDGSTTWLSTPSLCSTR